MLQSQPDSDPESASSTDSPPGCLDSNDAAAFVEGRLSEEDRARVERHIDACDLCRRVLSELAGMLIATRPDVSSVATANDAECAGGDEALLVRGERVGRYVVERFLGAGGMGVVYAAQDPELKRRVALKILRSGRIATEVGHNRLLREARAMARLAHPNVVSIHDVILHGSRLCIAMELVEGVTLRAWLQGRPSWRQTLRVFAAAGAGLVAAHRVGLVHRDFKPENVLCAEDGRVLVTDFGLARLTDLGESAVAAVAGATSTDDEESARDRTRTGAVLGTPAYMAPEQMNGQVAEARSDQFSFCVALQEALYGDRQDRSARRQDPTGDHGLLAGEPGLGSGERSDGGTRQDGAAPKWIRRVLERGLRAKAEERYPSMDTLLSALGRDPRVFWLRAGGVVSIALVVVLAGAGYRHSVRRGIPDCAAGETKLVGVWDAEREGAVRKALLSTGARYASETWDKTQAALDDYSHRWVQTYKTACEQTFVLGAEPAERFDQRMECLLERKGELRALVEVLARADREMVVQAPEAARAIVPASACNDAEWMRARARRTTPARQSSAELESVRNDLARVKALYDTGRYQEALQVVTVTLSHAERTGVRSMVAETLLQLGTMQLRGVGDTAAADATLQRAAFEAQAAGDDRTLGRTLSALIDCATMDPQRGDIVIPIYLNQGFALVERLGGNAEIEALLRTSHALWMLERTYDFPAARVELDQALPLLERLYGPEHPMVAWALTQRGRALVGERATDQAREVFQRVLAILEKQFGQRHHEIALVHYFMSEAAVVDLQWDAAANRIKEAIDLGEETYGAEHRLVGNMHFWRGWVSFNRDRLVEALASFERSQAILVPKLGETHPHCLWAMAGLGVTYLALKQYGRAVEVLERVASKAETDRLVRAASCFWLAKALHESGRAPQRAVDLARQSRLLYEQTKRSPHDDQLQREAIEWLDVHARERSGAPDKTSVPPNLKRPFERGSL